MVTPGCLLRHRDSGWQLVALGDTPATRDLEAGGPQDWADQVRAFVDQHHLSRTRLIMALSARDVAAATFRLEPDEARQRRTLQFELEEYLAWASEQMVADFLVDGEAVLGVAIESERWLPWVTALESRQLRLVSITSEAMLALQQVAAESWCRDSDLLVWHDAEWTHFFWTRNGRPAQWRVVGRDAVAAEWRAACANSGGSCLRVARVTDDSDLDAALTAEDEPIPAVVSAPPETPQMSSLCQLQAGEIVAGRVRPWFEWRRDRLATGDRYWAIRPALRTLIASAILFMASVWGLLGWLTWRHQQRIEDLYQQQRQVYRDTFPGTQLPAAVLSRIRSEHTRRFASRQPPRDVSLPVPALSVLRDFLAGLPAAERLRVREVRIEDGRMDVDAEVRSHAAASRVADALREHCFRVPGPTTVQNQDRSVSVRLFAEWQATPPREGTP